MLVQTVNTIWTKGEMQEDQVELVKKSIDNGLLLTRHAIIRTWWRVKLQSAPSSGSSLFAFYLVSCWLIICRIQTCIRPPVLNMSDCDVI